MPAKGRALLLVGLLASPAAASPPAVWHARPGTTATPGDSAGHQSTPAPRDNTLAGRVLISGSAALFVPTGHLDESTHQRERMGAGPGFALDLGFGVAGNLVVGAWGQYAFVGPGTGCHDCATSTIAAGGFAAYHLRANGSFDPWASAGLGYRTTSIGKGVVAPTTAYSGFEWLRVRLGADWYALDKVGFGGFVELDGGTYTRKTEGSLTNPDFTNSAPHWALLAGASVAFDSFGR
jgi:hypothetical protein